MEVVADLGQRMFRCFALEVAELVHTATLHRRPRPYLANGTAQPGISVDDAEHRRAQATAHQIVEAPLPRCRRLTTAQLQGQQMFAPSDRTPTTPRTGTLT